MKKIFKQIITDSQEREYNNLKRREFDFPDRTNKIIAFIGVRRSGKTHLMFQIIKELRNNIDRRNISYINFEDDRIFPLTIETVGLITDAYYELYPEKRKEKVWFFFDEIQNVPDWEKFIRRLYDTENCQIIISGSSSKLLSKEIATSLRGRTISYEIFPLSFKEYLNFQNIEINLYSSEKKAHIIHALEKYIHTGGFPELLFNEASLHKRILKEYVDLIIYKDLIERYQIKNLYLMKTLVKFSFSNTATFFSFNKLFNDLKSRGLSLSKNTLYEYFEYLEDAYAVFTTTIKSNSVRSQARNPKKIYAVDTGFHDIVSMQSDIGHKFENIVFLQLRRNYSEINYWKDIQEVDLCFETGNGIQLINVSYDLSDKKTYEREINALNEGMKKLNISESILITNGTEEKIVTEHKTINIIPLYKWLLTE